SLRSPSFGFRGLVRGFKPGSGRTRGLKGAFHWGAAHPAETEPSHEEQLGGSNEDGEKSSPRLRGRTCRDFGGAGGRSSRHGETGPVREDLLPLPRGLLLPSGHGSLSQY